MKYFTEEEARLIMRNNDMGLCTLFENNPNREAMGALADQIRRSKFQGDCYWMACIGFVLGRATGIREERARRKEAAV